MLFHATIVTPVGDWATPDIAFIADNITLFGEPHIRDHANVMVKDLAPSCVIDTDIEEGDLIEIQGDCYAYFDKRSNSWKDAIRNIKRIRRIG